MSKDYTKEFFEKLGWVYGKYDDQNWHRFESNNTNTISQCSVDQISKEVKRREIEARLNELKMLNFGEDQPETDSIKDILLHTDNGLYSSIDGDSIRSRVKKLESQLKELDK